MTDVASLQQVVHQAWVYAREARQYSQMAHDRATLTMQDVQHAYHRATMACLALSMSEANPFTWAITATILAKYDLLDEELAIRPPAEGSHRRSAKSTRRRQAGTMTTDAFRQHCITLINHLLAQGFEPSISLARMTGSPARQPRVPRPVSRRSRR
jgi:hypothetical protein